MYMKKMNKKGFTLVELLAVIVVLAVIMLLAVNAVIPQMTKARKNAFVTEAENVINSASTYYQSAILTGIPAGDTSTVTATGGCIKVNELKGDYLEKDDDDFKGSVKIEIGADNVAKYTVWLSNGEYLIEGKSGDEIKEANVTSSTTAASESCGS